MPIKSFEKSQVRTLFQIKMICTLHQLFARMGAVANTDTSNPAQLGDGWRVAALRNHHTRRSRGHPQGAGADYPAAKGKIPGMASFHLAVPVIFTHTNTQQKGGSVAEQNGWHIMC